MCEKKILNLIIMMIVYLITSQFYNRNKNLKVKHIIYIPNRSIGFYLDKIDQSTDADIFNIIKLIQS